MARPRILVIDADLRFRDWTWKILASANYEVVSTASGDEGLSHFGEGAGWGLVLLDHTPGTLDGEGAARQLHFLAPAVPILMITAHGTIALQKRVLGDGVMGVLPKPISPDLLLQTVRRALAKWCDTDLEHKDVVLGSLPTGSGCRPLSLETLLGLPTHPGQLSGTPPACEVARICFRTLNGFKYWPVPIPEEDQETAARCVLRVFDVRTPSGANQRCAVELAIPVRRLVRETTGEDYPAYHRLWDTVCKSALSAHLWSRAEIPKCRLLVHVLDREQLRMVRAMAGLAADGP